MNQKNLRIVLITLAVLLALAIGAILYFVAPEKKQFSSEQSSFMDYKAATSSTMYSDNNSSSKKIYKSQEDYDDIAFEKQLQVRAYALDMKCVVLVKNNSKANLYIATYLTFYDKSGKQISIDIGFADCVAVGEEMAYYLSCDEEYDHAEYELQVLESEYEPSPIEKDLVYQSDEVLVIAENNGPVDSFHPEVVALFFQGDELVDAKTERASVGGLNVGEATKMVIPLDSTNKNTRIEYYVHADPFVLLPE